MELKIEIQGIDKMVRDLHALGSQRIPNYVARAITGVADKVQTAMIEEAMQNLTVRGHWIRPGTKYGINRKAATKNNLEATISTKAPWLVEQESDVIHKPRESEFLIVPFPQVRSSRTETAPIPRRLTPARMGDKLVRIRTKKGPVLFQRVKGAAGRGKARKTISMLVPMWALEKTVRIPKRVHVLDVAQRVANEHAEKSISQAIAAAIAEQGF
ncbi:MAG: hypothetical protein M0Z38_06805 [Deltaproteobacteria bacterium]|nr:hypothetical protein [Deltaproteobacteria bacterium]